MVHNSLVRNMLGALAGSILLVAVVGLGVDMFLEFVARTLVAVLPLVVLVEEASLEAAFLVVELEGE